MIGILDSGLGGLSVLNQIHEHLPHHSLSYFGDSAWCPYGNKPYKLIQERVDSITNYFIEKGAKSIVIACNSATIACIEYLRATYQLPIIGMEPGVKPASEQTKIGKIGVFATEASLSGQKFHRLVSTHAQHIKVITQPCPLFVTLVESGKLKGTEIQNAIHDYMRPMRKEKIDTLVLGCTHYPFLKSEIQALYPYLTIIDTGKAVAKQVKRKHPSPLPSSPPTFTFTTTGDVAHASRLLPTLCPEFQNHYFQGHNRFPRF